MDKEIVVIAASLLTIGATLWLLTPIVRALAERIRPHPPAIDPAAEAFRDDVLAELQQVRREIAELGERVDFAERLLAKRPEAERLGPPR